MYGPLPPEAVTVAVPLLFPQDAGVDEPVNCKLPAEAVIVALAVAVHAPAPVTVTL